MDKNANVFVVHVSSFGSKMIIYLARKAQLALLLAEKVNVPAKYSDFANVFLEELANKLPEQTGVNEHAIKLEEGKQPPYGPINSLGPVEFKTLKTEIKISLANAFIRASKSLAGAPILFVCKPNSSFCLYIKYQRLNNLTIKNWYPLSLIGESLNL